MVVEYLEVECADMPSTRPVYLLGESFGGLLALAVALRCLSQHIYMDYQLIDHTYDCAC